MNDQDSEFEKRITAKKLREEAEAQKTNGEDPRAPYKLPCGCETYIGEQSAFTNMSVPFPFILLDGSTPTKPINPTLMLQFCKKCKGPHKSWWEIPKAAMQNPSKLFKL